MSSTRIVSLVSQITGGGENDQRVRVQARCLDCILMVCERVKLLDSDRR